jgi:hypothetical protein
MLWRSKVRSAVIGPLLVVAAVALGAASTNLWQQEQTPPILLGTSGGNADDISDAFCCSGTLGSLVTDGTNEYILSNNHVLANTDTSANTGGAPAGENVIQPGLVDVACNASNAQVVAHVTTWVPLGTDNVDAAIAGVVSGEVKTDGSILGIGPVSTTAGTPSLNEKVAKSGRTTQLTCGSISSVATSVKVQYQAGCGSGQKFFLTYTNQVAVNSSSFSAAGDSGSLIVDQTNVEPVALLFAGSRTVTIANPIQDVLAGLSSVDGKAVSFVGTSNPTAVSCPVGGGPKAAIGPVSRASLQRALDAKRTHEQELLADPPLSA